MQVKLNTKSLLFIVDFAISKAEGTKEVSIENGSDQFKRTLAASIRCGVLASDVDFKDIVATMKNPELKALAEVELGLKVSGFADVIKAPVEILEIETAEEVEETVQDEPVEEDAPADCKSTGDIVIPDAVLADLLKGTNRVVAKRLKSATLSNEDKLKLLEIEGEGKNRATVISLIKEA
jgi:hypothetical protein